MNKENIAEFNTHSLENGAVSNLPIEVVVSVGKTRPELRELLRLNESSVLTLDRQIDSPVELLVGDKCIAKGQLEEIPTQDGKNQLAVRLTEIITEKL